MIIGFDAKRAFHNRTGLGNYSRTLVQGLATFYPEHRYLLFNPRPSREFHLDYDSVREILPKGVIDKRLSSLWRSSWVKSDLRREGIDLYHGLSNEIPVGLPSTKIRSVVTIHDLIFERYPQQFKKIDVSIYQKKYRYACQYADRIIAISGQTRDDLVEFYRIDPSRIDVCYQSCDPVFAKKIGDDILDAVSRAYRLPVDFFLSVGSVIERKNLLRICEALVIEPSLPPLVVVGRGGSYLQRVKEFIAENSLQDRVIFLNEERNDENFPLTSNETLAALYRLSTALVYPSFFEGFGIPVLEALWSETPVITSSTSCLPEAGGPSSLYVDPSDSSGIASAMMRIAGDETLKKKMGEEGLKHAAGFSLEACTNEVMKVYKKTIDDAGIISTIR